MRIAQNQGFPTVPGRDIHGIGGLPIVIEVDLACVSAGLPGKIHSQRPAGEGRLVGSVVVNSSEDCLFFWRPLDQLVPSSPTSTSSLRYGLGPGAFRQPFSVAARFSTCLRPSIS